MFIRLFYSTKCNECMNLLQVIINEGINDIIIKVCLDKLSSKELQQLGSSIREVPTIAVSMGEKIDVFEGPMRCSQWLTNFTLNRRKNLAQQIEHNRRLIQKEHAVQRMREGGPLEYCENEMDGVSDNYAYTATDLFQPKSFVMVGNEDSSRIITFTNVNNEKLDDSAMRRYIAEQESARDRDNQEMKRIMEQKQIQAVINNSYNLLG